MRIFVLLIIWLIAIVLLSYICFITKSNDINSTNKKKSIETIMERDINTTDNSTINIINSSKKIEENLTKKIETEEDNITNIPISTPNIETIETVEKEKKEEENNLTVQEESDILENNITTNKDVKKVAIDKILLCQDMFNSILSKEKIYFDKNRFNIKDNSISTLDKLMKISKECPNGKIVIAGYTDSTGSAKSNRKISLKRANAIKRYFIEAGISNKRLVSVGYGEIKPIATNSTAKGREKNRRIEIHIEGVRGE